MARFRKTDKANALGKVGLFAGLSKKELGFIAGLTTETTLEAGSALVEQGELGREAMVIMAGTAVVRRNNRKVAELGPGDVVGEMSLINHAPRNATVVATTDVTVLHMDAREFTSVMESNKRLTMKLLKTVAARLADNQPASTV